MAAAAGSVVLAITNWLLYKLALVPMKNHPFFLHMWLDEGVAIVVGQQSAEIGDGNGQDSEVVRPDSVESERKITGGRIKQCAQRPKTCKDEGIAIVVGQQSVEIGDCNEQDSKVVRPDSMSEQTNITGRRFKQCAKGPKTRKGRRGSAMKRAPEVAGKYPTYTKCMKISNVARVFWLHISSDFCRRYLPKHNAIMTLEDEDGQRSHAKYISCSYGLSGGWNDFAREHSLEVGDTVVFQLVRRTKFKVYIKRGKEFTTTDDDVRSKEVTTKASSSALGDDANNQVSEEALDDVDGTISPDPDIEDLDGLPSFKDLNIFINRLLVNPELFSDRLRGVYYDLCRNQKSLLHRHLPTNINHTLVIAVIMETTKIAEGITAASSREDLVAWKKILKSFELLGMDVGFLCERVNDFLGLPTARSSPDQQPSVDCKDYEEVNVDKGRATEKMRSLKLTMAALHDALKAMETDMEEMESSEKKTAEAMRQIASAPW